MRLFNRFALAPILPLLLGSEVTFAQSQFPRSQGAISDFARKLTPTTRERLEAVVTEFQRRSGIDFRVVTIPKSDLRGRSIEEYSIGLARLWAVGRVSGSRGLLLVVAIGPRDKGGVYHGATRLEVSRSLERDIPNRLAARVTTRIRDSLMAGWFDGAVTIGVDEVVSAIDQKQREAGQNAAQGYPPPAPPRSQSVPAAEGSSSRSAPDMFGFVLLLLFLAVPAFIIAAIVRGIAKGTGPGYPAGDKRWTRRGAGIGIGTSVALGTTAWISQESTNNAAMDSSSTTLSDSTGSSSWTDSSSTSFSDSSSSSLSDSNSSGSSGGDFGGGGSTDSW